MLIEVQPVPPAPSREAVKAYATREVRTLAPGEILFREGEPRTQAYRVETGALCLFKVRPDGTEDVLEFAFPGDVVGVGYLDTHVTGAQASVETALTCLPRTGVDPAVEESERSPARLTASIEREIALLSQALIEADHRPQAERRVAALFATLSRYNAYEGRDPAVITDSLSCGVVAGYLGLTLDALAAELANLEARGLIEPCEGGLRLKDLDALERLAADVD